jgi:dynein heavy chain 2
VKQSIDSLKLVSSWNESELSGVAVKVKLEGLLVQGCRFEGQQVLECTSDDNALNAAPICYAAWVPQVTQYINAQTSHSN